MRSYRELSLRYLKAKKGRSLTIIFGIIISVALITGVFALVDSFKGNMIQDYEKTSKVYANLVSIKGRDVSKIINNVKLEKASFSHISGGLFSDYLEDGHNYVYIEEVSVDEIYLQSYENRIKEGVLPTKPDELIISYDYLESIDKNIGDTITIKFKDAYDESERELTGKVVATEKSSNSIVRIVDESSLVEDRDYMIKLRYKNPKDTVDSVNEIGNSLGIENITARGIVEGPNAYLNDNYLTLLGEDVNNGRLGLINTLRGVLIILVIISSVGLIYNGFMISVNDRNKEFALLRAVGISKNQIKRIVIKEAIIIGLIGIALGIIAGILGIYIVLAIVSSIKIEALGKIHLNISAASIIGSIVVSVITIMISVVIPLNKAAKVSPVDGMKNSFSNDENIKLTRSKGLFTRLFGAAGNLADKSLRRNRGRFKSVVLGFSLSIFIFVSFTSFVEITNKTVEVQDSVSSYELRLNANANVEKLIALEGVKNIYTEYQISHYSESEEILNINEYKLKEHKLTENFKNMTSEDVRYRVLNIDSSAIKEKNLGKIKGDLEKYKNGIVLQNKAIAIQGNKKTLVDITNYKVGDKVDIEINYSIFGENLEESTEKIITLKDVEIVGIIEDGITVTDTMVENPAIYMGDDLFNKLISDLKGKKSGSNIIVVPEDELAAEKIYDEVNENKEEYNVLYFISQEATQREWAKMMLVFKIGVYGFLILITLITLTNILTSVTSSIENRRKEIALLRSVGTSRKFIKKMIFIENLNYYLYSILFGGVLGIIASAVISRAFSSSYEGIYVFPIKPIIISSIILLILVSAISRYSIGKLCENNIVEEIREE